MDRGVIASPGIIIPQRQGFMLERNISAEEVRYYLMYWDRVVIPGNNLVYIGIPEEEELIACGAISRPRVAFQGSYGGDMVTNAILACQRIVAEKLIPDTSVDWVIHQVGNNLSLPSEVVEEKNILRVALAGALPVPVASIPIADILEFKERRHNELKELHDALDEMYLDILSTPDRDLATKKTVSRLKESVSNLGSVASEKFKNSRKYDIEVQLNLSANDMAAGISTGALIDFFSNGFTIPVATVAGAVLSAVRISSKAAYTFAPASHKQKFAYLCHASQEGLVDANS